MEGDKKIVEHIEEYYEETVEHTEEYNEEIVKHTEEIVGHIDTDDEEEGFKDWGVDCDIDTDDEEEGFKDWGLDCDIDTDEEKERFKYWWEDYDGDIEEERMEIEERVSKIEDPKERLDRYEELLNALEYNEYFAYNPHFKCESYLINARMYLEKHKDEDIKKFIDRILYYTNMVRTPWPCAQNILIVNRNRKFTFLNNVKLDSFNKLSWDKVLEKGKTKLRREYLHTWEEGKDDLEYTYEVVFVELCR